MDDLKGGTVKNKSAEWTSSISMQNFRLPVSKQKKMNEGERFGDTLCPPRPDPLKKKKNYSCEANIIVLQMSENCDSQ